MFNFFMPRRSRMCRNMIYTLLPFDKIQSMILDTSSYVLIDVRTKSEYDFMHVINAINIPVAKLRMCENEYRNKNGIIVYCSSGQRSKEAIMILNSMGYSNIYIWQYGAITNFPYKDMIVI